MKHILVMDDTEKDDIPEGAANFRYQTTYSSDGRQTSFQRELPISGIKPHILVMDDTEKDDIPEGVAKGIKPHILVMDDTEKDDIPEGAANFRYQTTYSNDGRHRGR